MPQLEKNQKDTLPPLSTPSRAKLIMAQAVKDNPSWEKATDLDKLSLQVSGKILQLFQDDYSQNEEDMYILLANRKTGVIEKVCDKFVTRAKSNCWAENGFFQYLNEISGKEGYFVVGYYHSHPGPKGNGLAGDFLSGDDFPAHDKLKNDVIRLLGNGAGKVTFQTRAFIPLNPYLLGKEHPLLKRQEEFKKNNSFAVSRYDGEVNENLLELKIIPIDSKTSINADDILDKHPPFMYVERSDLKNIKALSIFEILRGPTKQNDPFPYLGPETKSHIEAKLRYDGALRVSLMMSYPPKIDGDFSNYRSFSFYFREDGRQDTVNYSELDPRKIRADLNELLEKFPDNIKEQFKMVMNNYKTILDK